MFPQSNDTFCRKTEIQVLDKPNKVVLEECYILSKDTKALEL